MRERQGEGEGVMMLNKGRREGTDKGMNSVQGEERNLRGKGGANLRGWEREGKRGEERGATWGERGVRLGVGGGMTCLVDT